MSGLTVTIYVVHDVFLRCAGSCLLGVAMIASALQFLVVRPGSKGAKVAKPLQLDCWSRLHLTHKYDFLHED